jgi:hypothetical protein
MAVVRDFDNDGAEGLEDAWGLTKEELVTTEFFLAKGVDGLADFGHERFFFEAVLGLQSRSFFAGEVFFEFIVSRGLFEIDGAIGGVGFDGPAFGRSGESFAGPVVSVALWVMTM